MTLGIFVVAPLLCVLSTWGVYEAAGGAEAAATRGVTRTAAAIAAAETRAHLPTATPRPTGAPSGTVPPSPTQPTPTPSLTPTLTGHALTVADIEHNYDRLTSLQWDQYAREVTGMRVHWRGTVRDVSDSGNVYLEMGQEFLHNIYLEGLPRDVAMAMTKGQALEFEATVRKLSTFLGLSVWLDDPELLDG